MTLDRWEYGDPFEVAARKEAHEQRHSAASELINSGVDLYTVGAVLGHKSSQSTKRYAHLATDTMRAAIGKIGQKLTHHGQSGAR